MSGADKAMLPLAGEALIAHVIRRAEAQVSELLLNANGDISRFQQFGREVIADSQAGFPGPLAGILAGFDWVKQHGRDAKWLVTMSCDCPFLPIDLVSRLVEGAENASAQVAVAASGARHHPVIAAWSMRLALDVDEVLNRRGLRKVDDLVGSVANVRVEFAEQPFDPFFNVNTPDDLARAEALMNEHAHV